MFEPETISRKDAGYPGFLEVFLGESAPPALRVLGNRAILDEHFVAFFCSARCPGSLLLAVHDVAQRLRAENRPVIGGFHSPPEREALKVLIRSPAPVCMAPARCIPERVPAEMRKPIAEGRLLLVSPFDEKIGRATEETASYRNLVVAALAESVFVAHAAPGGKTEKFCRKLREWGKPCMTLDDPQNANLIEMGLQRARL